MKHLMGLLKPDEGHIWVDGEDIVPLGDVEMGRLRRKFGMVFSTRPLRLLGRVEHRVPLPSATTTEGETADRVRDLLRRSTSGTSRASMEAPAELSGGQRCRPRAPPHPFQILLYDYPDRADLSRRRTSTMIRRTADESLASVGIARRRRPAHRRPPPRARDDHRRGTAKEVGLSAEPREFIEISPSTREGRVHEAELGVVTVWFSSSSAIAISSLDERQWPSGLVGLSRRIGVFNRACRRPASPSARSTPASWTRQQGQDRSALRRTSPYENAAQSSFPSPGEYMRSIPAFAPARREALGASWQGSIGTCIPTAGRHRGRDAHAS